MGLEERKGIQARVFGPKVAGTNVAGTGFALSAAAAKQLVGSFREYLTKHKTGPVQMLVDAAEVPPSVVNVSRYYGKAAVAHVLRAPPAGAGDVPALAGIFVLLPGLDVDADEAAVAAVESSREKSGRPLPLSPAVYESLRKDQRPLLAMIFFHEEAMKDTSLRMI